MPALLAILATLCAAALAAAAAERTAAKHDTFSSEKIIGGRTISIKEAKWAVEVVRTLPSGANGVPHYDICGGSLIKETLVLTAGHCVPDKVDAASIASLTLYIGTSYDKGIEQSGVKMLAQTFRRHDKFSNVEDADGTTPVYDVAVIRLKGAVTPGATIAVIGITKPKAEPKAGSTLAVIGWGITAEGRDDPSRQLKMGTYKVKSRQACKKEFGNKFNNQEICIASSPTSTFCNGDSGSPAFRGSVQYGVVSWGSCGQTDAGSGILANLAEPAINAFIRKMMVEL